MQGYSPIFSDKPKAEVASKIQSTFIELGVKNIEHKKECKCDDCNNKNT